MDNLWPYIEIGLIIALGIPTAIAAITGAPFVPTPMDRVKKMLKHGNMKPGDRMYDIGCGDGRSVYLAKKLYDADAIGFELSPLIYLYAKVRQKLWGSKAKVLFRDFRAMDLSDAKVIFCYLLPESLRHFKEKLLKELKPGTRIVSYAFEIEGWKPIHVEDRVPEKNFGRILVYEIGKDTL